MRATRFFVGASLAREILDSASIQKDFSRARLAPTGRPHGGLLQRIHIIANRAEHGLDKLIQSGDVVLPADVEPCVVITP
jgi:hypothetical protein